MSQISSYCCFSSNVFLRRSSRFLHFSSFEFESKAFLLFLNEAPHRWSRQFEEMVWVILAQHVLTDSTVFKSWEPNEGSPVGLSTGTFCG